MQKSAKHKSKNSDRRKTAHTNYGTGFILLQRDENKSSGGNLNAPCSLKEAKILVFLLSVPDPDLIAF